MPLPLTVSCFSKIQIGFTFLVPAHLGSPGKRAVKRMCVCVFYGLYKCTDLLLMRQHVTYDFSVLCKSFFALYWIIDQCFAGVLA